MYIYIYTYIYTIVIVYYWLGVSISIWECGYLLYETATSVARKVRSLLVVAASSCLFVHVMIPLLFCDNCVHPHWSMCCFLFSFNLSSLVLTPWFLRSTSLNWMWMWIPIIALIMNPVDRVTDYIRLVVSNIILFSMIYGMSSFPLTFIFFKMDF